MKMYKKLHLISVLLLTMVAVVSLNSCKKETISGVELDEKQLVAGRLAGTWASPSAVVVPESVSTEVFGGMRLVFTTDEQGYPAAFTAKDCPIIFSNTAGTWNINGTEEQATVSLTGITPVDEMDIKISGQHMVLSFHMGWENTETGETGQGDFSVTLTRQ